MCWRREGFCFVPSFISSIERPDFGVLAVLDIDISLVRGDGGMTVTLGLIDSLSVSPR